MGDIKCSIIHNFYAQRRYLYSNRIQWMDIKGNKWIIMNRKGCALGLSRKDHDDQSQRGIIRVKENNTLQWPANTIIVDTERFN